MCQVLGVLFKVSRLAHHLSYNNANSHSHGPSPGRLPKYAQQDVAADLDPSTMSPQQFQPPATVETS